MSNQLDMEVYSVATIREITAIRPRDLIAYQTIDTRTVAVMTDFNIALSIVENNELDIAEREYKYAVIEKYVLPMFYGQPRNEWWFVWDGTWDNGKYIRCEKPEQWEHVSGFGMS